MKSFSLANIDGHTESVLAVLNAKREAEFDWLEFVHNHEQVLSTEERREYFVRLITLLEPQVTAKQMESAARTALDMVLEGRHL